MSYETYNGDEILKKRCNWCSLDKKCSRSISINHIYSVAQEDGGICFDCYTRNPQNHTFICTECIGLINNHQPYGFIYEYNNRQSIHLDYEYTGKFTFCKECLSNRNYCSIELQENIENKKQEYVNNILARAINKITF